MLVLDNLNTHDPASLYKAFPPAEAARIWSRLELHYTPSHGSWLNMAELELSALARQCLHRRIPDRATLADRGQRLGGGAQPRRGAHHLALRVTDARRSLTHLYPIPESDT